MKPLPIILIATVWLGAFSPTTRVIAQDNVTVPRAEYEALKQQAERAKQLQAELDRARAGSNQVNSEKTGTSAAPTLEPNKPATSPATSNSPDPGKASVQPAGSAPVQQFAPLPPFDPDAVQQVSDIIQHFAQNRTEATQRYRGVKLKLQGVVAAFEKSAFRRDFDIVFRTSAGQLVCRVAPPDRYTAVFTTRSGATLTGRSERSVDVELMKIGDVVAVEGTGQGIKDGSILFTRCNVAGLK